MKSSKLIISFMVLGIVFLLTGTVSYFRNVFNGNIIGQTGDIFLNVTGFDDEVTKSISLNNNDGYIMPGDSGSFTLTLNATNSNDNVVSFVDIERTNLPDNLKFYDSSDYVREISNYGIYLGMDNQVKTLTVYWYWDGTKDNANDNLFMNQQISATIIVTSSQGNEDMIYAHMKNGAADETEFWQYSSYIRTITFSNDMSGLPSNCNEANYCWNISEEGSLIPVYGYFVDDNDLTIMGMNFDSTANAELMSAQSLATTAVFEFRIVSNTKIVAPEDSSYLFNMGIFSIDFNGVFDTSGVTDMNNMFYGCENLTSLDLSGFNTSNVTNMSQMFDNCRSLTSLDLSGFNTSNVTNMSQMFDNCRSLTSLDLGGFNTSNVIDMNYMFSSCSSLTSLNVSVFNTSNVADMREMFYSCYNLTSLNLSSFNTSNVTNMMYMFSDCSSLTSLDLSGFDTSKVANMNGMFNGCSNLTSLDLSSFDFYSINNVIVENLDADSWFNNSDVTLLNSLRDFSTVLSTEVYGVYGMFDGCSKLTTTINMNNANITDYEDMFKGAATDASALITVNYTAEASSLVDLMILTKSAESHVVKGSLIP